MKYKFVIFLLSITLVLSGCGKGDASSKNILHCYYMHNELKFGDESGVIVSANREIDGNTDDYFLSISQYLNGPTSYDCISPFPAGTVLEDLSWDQNRVQIVLSPHITTLSGVDLMVACACLTKTVAELTGIDTVQIRSSSGLLNGEQVLTLTSANFMFWDQAMPHGPAN